MPGVLLLSTERGWWGIARMPESLRVEGFTVSVLCPRGALVARSVNVDHLFEYRSITSGLLLFYLLIAYLRFRPDLIVPGDDRAAIFLHRCTASRSLLSRIIPAGLRRVLYLSTGGRIDPALVRDKRAMQDYARSLDIPCPPGMAVAEVGTALAEASRLGYPVILKLARGQGGREVVVCHDEAELKQVFSQLSERREPTGLRKLKSLVKGPLFTDWGDSGADIILQKFIDGRPAYHAFYAINGKIPAGITAVTVENYPDKFGPGSVIRVTDHPEIADSVSRFVGGTGYSGFGCIDFMIDARGVSYLLEFNPRITLVSFLGKDLGVNMCGIAKAHIENDGVEKCVGLPVKHEIVALYPLELARDPNSRYLQECFHARPEGEPGLLRYYTSAVSGDRE